MPVTSRSTGIVARGDQRRRPRRSARGAGSAVCRSTRCRRARSRGSGSVQVDAPIWAVAEAREQHDPASRAAASMQPATASATPDREDHRVRAGASLRRRGPSHLAATTTVAAPKARASSRRSAPARLPRPPRRPVRRRRRAAPHLPRSRPRRRDRRARRAPDRGPRAGSPPAARRTPPVRRPDRRPPAPARPTTAGPTEAARTRRSPRRCPRTPACPATKPSTPAPIAATRPTHS